MSDKEIKNNYEEISEFHLDALQELGNIGAGHAAIALTDFLKKSTYMSIPEVEINDVNNLLDIVKFPKGNQMAIISLESIKDLYYSLFAFIDESSVQRIIDIMTTDVKSDSAEMINLSPLFMSLIKEVGSILLLKYVEALNDFLEVESYPSPPVMRIGTLESITENEFKEMKIKNQKVLFIECDIFTNERKIQVDMAIVPHEKSINQFMKSFLHEKD